MQLSKYHGLGNDFLITFADGVAHGGAELARRLCHRTHGVGADGLIFATEVEAGEGLAASATFALFNSDGSRAEVSGNGLRCFAQAVACHLDRNELVLAVKTDAGARRVDVSLDEVDPVAVAAVEMGEMTPLGLGSERTDRLSALLADAVGRVERWGTGSLGNPHIVLQVRDPLSLDLRKVGPAIESEFADDHGGINVHLIAPRVDGDGIDLRVWERGAGITEACGSGACAAGAMAASWGLAANPVNVHMPGGTATVSLSDTGITLTGPSVFIADIVVADD
jgi:diaminopimelate epimerase